MSKKSIVEFLKKNILVSDGAMGTSLAALTGFTGPPELLNVEHPEIVSQVHQQFLDAGALAISTNSFGANRIKLLKHGLSERAQEFASAAMKIARKAAGDERYVFGSVGPTGVLVEPIGTTTFDEVYAAFAEQTKALADAGADAILLETFIDIQEARIALLAAKENTSLPVFVSVTFSARGRLEVSGTTPEAAASILEKLGADGVGANCSLGPAQLVEIGKRMCEKTKAFVILQPNAGLPRFEGGLTFYDATPEEYIAFSREAIAAGANVIGGCCGSTPEHIKAISSVASKLLPRQRELKRHFFLCTPTEYYEWNLGSDFLKIGERINPSGKKDLQEDIRSGEFKLVEKVAKMQIEAGADVLDVNVSVPLVDEVKAMTTAIRALYTLPSPISIDTALPEAAEQALKLYPGRALLNSVSAKRESIEKMLPIAKRFGAAIVGLAILDKGIAKTVQEKVEAADLILKKATDEGIDRSDILFDLVALTAATSSVNQTLSAVEELSRRGLYTVLGLSNISHGLPSRPAMNRTFAALAVSAGLTAAIIDPIDGELKKTIKATMFLKRRTEAFELEPVVGVESTRREIVRAYNSSEKALFEAIFNGKKNEVKGLVKELLNSSDAFEVVSKVMAPAMQEVGRAYENGRFFLPNVLLAAEAMKEAFELVRPALEKGAQSYNKAKIVMATVEGDIHDIGKNIVVSILSANGYSVVDLGVDVSPEAIVRASKENKAAVVGLSCLMTTTLPALKKTIELFKLEAPETQIAIGGAIVTDKVKESFGADIYAKDAMEFVRILDELKNIK